MSYIWLHHSNLETNKRRNLRNFYNQSNHNYQVLEHMKMCMYGTDYYYYGRGAEVLCARLRTRSDDCWFRAELSTSSLLFQQLPQQKLSSNASLALPRQCWLLSTVLPGTDTHLMRDEKTDAQLTKGQILRVELERTYTQLTKAQTWACITLVTCRISLLFFLKKHSNQVQRLYTTFQLWQTRQHEFHPYEVPLLSLRLGSGLHLRPPHSLHIFMSFQPLFSLFLYYLANGAFLHYVRPSGTIFFLLEIHNLSSPFFFFFSASTLPSFHQLVWLFEEYKIQQKRHQLQIKPSHGEALWERLSTR